MSTNYLLEVRPGEGGTDAETFATELLHALTSHARRQGHVQHETSSTKTLTAHLDEKAMRSLSTLTGTHRVQRVPSNDKRGRRHTSTATVAIVPAGQVKEVRINDKDLLIDYFRGSGPGGQHRNKTSTAVRLRHQPSGILITRTSGRSKIANLQSAKDELLARLQEEKARRADQHTNSLRAAQVQTERSAKTFTHNQQRDESISHDDSRRWRMTDFMNGRLDR